MTADFCAPSGRHAVRRLPYINGHDETSMMPFLVGDHFAASKTGLAATAIMA
ncbi:MAG: hypothetical protein ABW213_09075 [Tardiphaga sp.]